MADTKLARKPTRDELFVSRTLALVDRIEDAVDMRRSGYEYREIERWLMKEHGIKRRHAQKYKRIIKARLEREVGGDQRDAWAQAVSMALKTFRAASESTTTIRKLVHDDDGRKDYIDEVISKPDIKNMVAAGRWFSDLWGLNPKIAINFGSEGELERADAAIIDAFGE